MTRPGIALLHRLFDRWQKDPDSDKPVTLALTNKVKEFQTQSAAERAQLELTLKDAQRCGVVELVPGTGGKAHLLARINLLDPLGLASFLNVTPSNQLADKARSDIQTQYQPKTALTKQLLEDLLENWYHNKGFMTLQIGQQDKAVVLLKALDAVSNLEHRGKDLRSFSAVTLGDSKAMETIDGLFTKVWQQHYGGDLSPTELYESMGLCKFPQPVFIKGPLEMEVAGGHIDCSQIRSYVGFAPDSVTQISAKTTPDYILTIENLASYNRHCREIADNGVVLFSSGFPSPDFCQMLTLLGTSIGAEVPFYHWSDIDLGGLRIFRRIAGVLHDELGGKELHPHLMTAEVLSEYAEYGKKKTAKVLSNYERIKKDCPQLSTLIDRMLIDGEDCMTLEQENLSPQSVL